MSLKYIYILILLVLLSSCCKKKNIEKENTYQVLTLLVNDYKKFIVLSPSFPPPLLNKIKTQDSLWVYKYFIKQSLKNKTIALTSNFFKIKETYSFRGKCNVDVNLMEKFNSLNKNEELDVSKITLYGKDSLIIYKEEYKKLRQRGFKKIDLALNFSRIAFNKEFNKAIIIVSASKGHLNRVSTLLYLEKENYVWKIKCEHGLSMS